MQAAEEEGMQAPREGADRCSSGYIAEPNDTGWWTSSVKSPDFPRKLVSNWGPTNRHTAEGKWCRSTPHRAAIRSLCSSVRRRQGGRSLTVSGCP